MNDIITLLESNPLNTFPNITTTPTGYPIYNSPYIELRDKLRPLIWDYCQRKDITREEKEQFVLQARPDFPLAACFNVHSVCNLECVMCPYSGTTTEHKKRRMEAAVFKKLLHEFYTVGGKIFTFNNFSDIFAHPSGLEYIDIAFSYKDKMHLYCVTNAVGMKKEYTDYLFSKGFDGIMFFSCHGLSNETYKKVTGKDYFNQAMKNILYALAKHPTPNRVIIQFATDFSSPEEINQAKIFWQKKGCFVNFFPTHTFAGTSSHKTEGQHQGPLAGCAVGWGRDAGLPFYQIVIQPEGSVSLCCIDVLERVYLGNVIEDGIKNVWNSHRFLALIKNLYCGGSLPDDFICRNCDVHIA